MLDTKIKNIIQLLNEAFTNISHKLGGIKRRRLHRRLPRPKQINTRMFYFLFLICVSLS
jgi:hypothetical protein